MKIYFFSRLRFALIFLLGALVFWYFSHPLLLVSTARQVSLLLTGRLIPIYSVEIQDKKVALSFDATWGADQTSELLRILRENKVKCTFFLCGLWLEKYPEMVKRIAAEGHEIGNHSYTHPHLNNLSPEEIAHELLRTHELIKELTGQISKVFRPPFGEYNNKVIETAEACHYTTIIWDVDSLDWKDLSSAEMITRILSKIKPGSIVLFHNAGKHTPHAVTTLIPTLKRMGYDFLPVSRLLLSGETYTDHTGRQRQKRTAPIETPKVAPSKSGP